ncbi:TRAP transporter small permease subunit [Roseovarius sp. SCSIO 43702]|uniref:TRAP transporter small permease n=1 Tax=Roseovarius sp. SCSIO 43702 TaxID=2823043 RepID=UPI001C730A7E|nr:TRAP transporter small permease subunit [Roseovarius sp. SCSIO 43702]QYX56768.1 TRAP transporter small permease subunit [Roseovarius sp. SCSIO 43702]
MLKRVSAAWARIELAVAACLAVGVTLLILLNVVTRYMGNALYWVDEAAIYAMIWMTFLGASAAVHYGNAVAITILTDVLPRTLKWGAAKLVDAIIFAFALFLLWFCWRWFAPLDLARAGFDIATFQSSTFNFVYAEPTLTIGIPKYIVWLIMWLFALGATLHSLAHLLDFSPVREAPDTP